MERFLPRQAFQKIINILKRDGYDVVGPQVKDGAIVYRGIDKVHQLPLGWRDDQSQRLTVHLMVVRTVPGSIHRIVVCPDLCHRIRVASRGAGVGRCDQGGKHAGCKDDSADHIWLLTKETV